MHARKNARKESKTTTHDLVQDGGVFHHSVELVLDFGGLHHVLHKVGVVLIDAHVGERVDAA